MAEAAARDERGEMFIIRVVETCPSSECIEGEESRGQRAFVLVCDSAARHVFGRSREEGDEGVGVSRMVEVWCGEKLTEKLCQIDISMHI